MTAASALPLPERSRPELRPQTGGRPTRVPGKIVAPIVLSALVAAFAFAFTSPVVDANTATPLVGVRLALPAGYVLLSPLSRALDGLSLLSVGQQVWLLLTLAIGAVVWELATGTDSVGDGKIRRTARVGAAVFTVVAVLNLTAILSPRPMASLKVSDPRTLTVDFHSHTNASRDARAAFSPERNRAWHSDGGFDFAYVSDHKTFAGAAAGEAANPAHAGDGTVLLNAIEARYLGLSIVVLGISQGDTSLLDKMRHLRPGQLNSGREPISIAVLPGPLNDLRAIARDGTPHVVGLELSDAAPRGFGQLDNDEAGIRNKIAELGLGMVSGSNNHGWGRTAAAWNIMQIDNWRALPPDSVGLLIENELRKRGAAAVHVVQRVRPRTHGLTLPFTVPVLVGQTLMTLTAGERVVWIMWIWAVVLLRSLIRRKTKSRRRTRVLLT
jgi:predicted metal-dependent phosphoesterase TrpH